MIKIKVGFSGYVVVEVEESNEEDYFNIEIEKAKEKIKTMSINFADIQYETGSYSRLG